MIVLTSSIKPMHYNAGKNEDNPSLFQLRPMVEMIVVSSVDCTVSGSNRFAFCFGFNRFLHFTATKEERIMAGKDVKDVKD